MPEPVKPLTDEQRDYYLNKMEGWIILLRKPQDNTYTGYVEESFSMGGHKERVLLWWTNHDHWLGRIDGEEDATKEAADIRRKNPDYAVEVFNARDSDIPVVLDWEGYAEAQRFDPNTLSGVSNKFKARNIAFTMKEMDHVEA